MSTKVFLLQYTAAERPIEPLESQSSLFFPRSIIRAYTSGKYFL